jgi:hypothetical protein
MSCRIIHDFPILNVPDSSTAPVGINPTTLIFGGGKSVVMISRPDHAFGSFESNA